MNDYDYWVQLGSAQRSGVSGHDDDGCIALFYDRPVLDQKATEIDGAPVYRHVTFVKIHVPGDPRTVVDEAVRDNYKRADEDPRKRWPKAWASYLAKGQGTVDGTPIEMFPVLSPAQVALMKHVGIQTVEQLAGVTDGNLRNLGMDGRMLRDRAQQYLKGSSETEKQIRSELAARDAKIADLEAKLNQLLNAPRTEANDGEAADDDEQPATDRMAAARAARAAKRAARHPENDA